MVLDLLQKGIRTMGLQLYDHNGREVEAMRYEPGWIGGIDVVSKLGDLGLGCVHFRKPTETIEIFSWGAEIEVIDPRHGFDGADGVVYAGDWIVWDFPFQIEIVPSSIFNAEYSPAS